MELPDCYRHIDWATWRLYGLERLSQVIATDAPAIASVLSMTDAYQAVENRKGQTGDPISRTLTKRLLSTASQWRLYKQFSSGLRYSFLFNKDLLWATVRQPVNPTGDPELTFTPGDGSFFALWPFPDDAGPAGQVAILQGGDPSVWYDISSWTFLQTLSSPGHLDADYPLIRPSYIVPRFDQLLRQIVAKREGQSEWHPPPASATLDVFDYLPHHPSISASAPSTTAQSVYRSERGE